MGDGNIVWDHVLEKQARGIDDYDLGEIQEVTSEYILTSRRQVDKKSFQIPKKLAMSSDGEKIIFNLSESDANSLYLTDKLALDSQRTIPLGEEKLESIKQESIVEAKIVKGSLKETKQVDVPLMHEELVIERKRLAQPRKIEDETVQSKTEIKIPLKREEIEMNKQSYITKVISKKRPIPETRTFTEEVTTKNTNVEDNEN